MNLLNNTIRNKDLTEITPSDIQNVLNDNTTSNVLKQFIDLYKGLPFSKYIKENIIAKSKKKDISDVVNITTEPAYSFLFQVVMIEDITKSTSSQVESLHQLITGEVQYADKVKNKENVPKRKVKQLSVQDEIENNGNGDTSVLLENTDTSSYNSAKDLTLRITLQDKTGGYYYCYTQPDKEGIVSLVELVGIGCIPLCKKILGIKVVLTNFTYTRGAIVLKRSNQIRTLARTSIPSWNEHFYSKMIQFWKNSLETRNNAVKRKLDSDETEEQRKYHQSRA